MYDPKCHEIAKAFLEDEPWFLRTPPNIARIAQVVQTAIEDEIAAINDERDQPEEWIGRGPDPDEWRHEAAEAMRLKR